MAKSAYIGPFLLGPPVRYSLSKWLVGSGENSLSRRPGVRIMHLDDSPSSGRGEQRHNCHMHALKSNETARHHESRRSRDVRNVNLGRDALARYQGVFDACTSHNTNILAPVGP